MTIVVAIFLFVVAVILSAMTNFWIGSAFFVGAFGSFIYFGLREIPADPPHKGILTVFGKRKEVIKDEGWRFFPFYPWYHGVIRIRVQKIDQDLPEETVRTPDRAELAVPVSITWTADKDDAHNLIEFLNSGGEAGVKNILEDIVRERLRSFFFSEDEGPQTWQEAQGAQEEVAAVLLKRILGDEALPKIHSDVPTTILLKYFNEPQRKPSPSEAKRWKANWEEVTKAVEPNLEEVRRETGERRKLIEKARQGNGFFKLPQLGIVVNRLNIGQIKLKGELAKVAESEVRKQQERLGEFYEVDTDVDKAKRLVTAAREAGQDLPFEEAYRIVLEWKATREGRGFTIPGLSQALAKIVPTTLGGR